MSYDYANLCTYVDNPTTIKIKHSNISSQVLAIHTISGCDAVADMYRVGNTTAISVTKKGLRLDTIGKFVRDIKQLGKEAKSFIVACYCSRRKCNSMTMCRQRMWALKTGKGATSASKLCCVPPTTETLAHNVLRCHCQRAQWYGAFKSDPHLMSHIEFG